MNKMNVFAHIESALTLIKYLTLPSQFTSYLIHIMKARIQNDKLNKFESVKQYNWKDVTPEMWLCDQLIYLFISLSPTFIPSSFRNCFGATVIRPAFHSASVHKDLHVLNGLVGVEVWSLFFIQELDMTLSLWEHLRRTMPLGWKSSKILF